jgi:hypothetical protein
MPHEQLQYESDPARAMSTRLARVTIILGPLLACTLLPVWTVWYIGPWEGTAERGTLWAAAQMFPANVRAGGLWEFVVRCCAGNATTAGVLLALGFGAERLVLWRTRRRVD